MSKVKITGHASGSGTITLTGPNTSSDRTITLPDATGTALMTDGSGASLTGLIAGSGAFSARGTSSWVNMSADDICQFSNDSTGYSFDTDNNYDTSTYKYTAPAAGLYFFFVNIYTAQDDASNSFNILHNASELDLTGDSTNLFMYNPAGGGTEDRVISGSITVLLAANDTIAIKAERAADMYPLGSSFGGCRLS